MKNGKKIAYKKLYLLLMGLTMDAAYASTVSHTTKKQVNLINLGNPITIDTDEEGSKTAVNGAWTIPANSTVIIPAGTEINFYNKGNKTDDVWILPGAGGINVLNNQTGRETNVTNQLAWSNGWVGFFVDPTMAWGGISDQYNLNGMGDAAAAQGNINAYDANVFANSYYGAQDTTPEKAYNKFNQEAEDNPDAGLHYNLDDPHDPDSPFYQAIQEGIKNPLDGLPTEGYLYWGPGSTVSSISEMEYMNRPLNVFNSTDYVLTSDNFHYNDITAPAPSSKIVGTMHTTKAQSNMVNNTNQPISIYNGEDQPLLVIPANSTLVIPAGTKYGYNAGGDSYYIQFPIGSSEAYIFNNETGAKTYLPVNGQWFSVFVGGAGGSLSWNPGQDDGVSFGSSNELPNTYKSGQIAYDGTVYNANNNLVSAYNENPSNGISYEDTEKSVNKYIEDSGTTYDGTFYSGAQVTQFETIQKPLELFNGAETYMIEPYNPKNPNGISPYGSNNPGTPNKVKPSNHIMTKKQVNLYNNSPNSITLKGDGGASFTIPGGVALVIPAGTIINFYNDGNNKDNVWIKFNNEGHGQPYFYYPVTGQTKYLQVQDQWYGFYINPEQAWAHGQVNGDNYDVHNNGSAEFAAYSVNNNFMPYVNDMAQKKNISTTEELSQLNKQNLQYQEHGVLIDNGTSKIEMSAAEYRNAENLLQPRIADTYVLEPYNSANPNATSKYEGYSDSLSGYYTSTRQINVANSSGKSIKMTINGKSETFPANSVLILPVGTEISFYNNGGGSDRVTVQTGPGGAYLMNNKTGIKTDLPLGTYSMYVTPSAKWVEGQTSAETYKDYTKIMHSTNGIFTVYDVNNVVDMKAYDELINKYGLSPYQASRIIEDTSLLPQSLKAFTRQINSKKQKKLNTSLTSRDAYNNVEHTLSGGVGQDITKIEYKGLMAKYNLSAEQAQKVMKDQQDLLQGVAKLEAQLSTEPNSSYDATLQSDVKVIEYKELTTKYGLSDDQAKAVLRYQPKIIHHELKQNKNLDSQLKKFKTRLEKSINTTATDINKDLSRLDKVDAKVNTTNAVAQTEDIARFFAENKLRTQELAEFIAPLTRRKDTEVSVGGKGVSKKPRTTQEIVDEMELGTLGVVYADDIVVAKSKTDKKLQEIELYNPLDSYTFDIASYDQVHQKETLLEYLKKHPFQDFMEAITLGGWTGVIGAEDGIKTGVSYGSQNFQKDWHYGMDVFNIVGLVTMPELVLDFIYADEVALEKSSEAVLRVGDGVKLVQRNNLELVDTLKRSFIEKGDGWSDDVKSMDKIRSKIYEAGNDLDKQEGIYAKLEHRRQRMKVKRPEFIEKQMQDYRTKAVNQIDTSLTTEIHSPKEVDDLLEIRDALSRPELTKDTFNNPLEKLREVREAAIKKSVTASLGTLTTLDTVDDLTASHNISSDYNVQKEHLSNVEAQAKQEAVEIDKLDKAIQDISADMDKAGSGSTELDRFAEKKLKELELSKSAKVAKLERLNKSIELRKKQLSKILQDAKSRNADEIKVNNAKVREAEIYIRMANKDWDVHKPYGAARVHDKAFDLISKMARDELNEFTIKEYELFKTRDYIAREQKLFDSKFSTTPSPAVDPTTEVSSDSNVAAQPTDVPAVTVSTSAVSPVQSAPVVEAVPQVEPAPTEPSVSQPAVDSSNVGTSSNVEGSSLADKASNAEQAAQDKVNTTETAEQQQITNTKEQITTTAQTAVTQTTGAIDKAAEPITSTETNVSNKVSSDKNTVNQKVKKVVIPQNADGTFYEKDAIGNELAKVTVDENGNQLNPGDRVEIYRKLGNGTRIGPDYGIAKDDGTVKVVGKGGLRGGGKEELPMIEEAQEDNHLYVENIDKQIDGISKKISAKQTEIYELKKAHRIYNNKLKLKLDLELQKIVGKEDFLDKIENVNKILSDKVLEQTEVIKSLDSQKTRLVIDRLKLVSDEKYVEYKNALRAAKDKKALEVLPKELGAADENDLTTQDLKNKRVILENLKKHLTDVNDKDLRDEVDRKINSIDKKLSGDATAIEPREGSKFEAIDVLAKIMSEDQHLTELSRKNDELLAKINKGFGKYLDMNKDTNMIKNLGRDHKNMDDYLDTSEDSKDKPDLGEYQKIYSKDTIELARVEEQIIKLKAEYNDGVERINQLKAQFNNMHDADSYDGVVEYKNKFFKIAKNHMRINSKFKDFNKFIFMKRDDTFFKEFYSPDKGVISSLDYYKSAFSRLKNNLFGIKDYLEPVDAKDPLSSSEKGDILVKHDRFGGHSFIVSIEEINDKYVITKEFHSRADFNKNISDERGLGEVYNRVMNNPNPLADGEAVKNISINYFTRDEYKRFFNSGKFFKLKDKNIKVDMIERAFKDDHLEPYHKKLNNCQTTCYKVLDKANKVSKGEAKFLLDDDPYAARIEIDGNLTPRYIKGLEIEYIKKTDEINKVSSEINNKLKSMDNFANHNEIDPDLEELNLSLKQLTLEHQNLENKIVKLKEISPKLSHDLDPYGRLPNANYNPFAKLSPEEALKQGYGEAPSLKDMQATKPPKTEELAPVSQPVVSNVVEPIASNTSGYKVIDVNPNNGPTVDGKYGHLTAKDGQNVKAGDKVQFNILDKQGNNVIRRGVVGEDGKTITSGNDDLGLGGAKDSGYNPKLKGKPIGKGQYGEVYEYGKDEVIKIYYDDQNKIYDGSTGETMAKRNARVLNQIYADSEYGGLKNEFRVVSVDGGKDNALIGPNINKLKDSTKYMDPKEANLLLEKTTGRFMIDYEGAGNFIGKYPVDVDEVVAYKRSNSAITKLYTDDIRRYQNTKILLLNDLNKTIPEELKSVEDDEEEWFYKATEPKAVAEPEVVIIPEAVENPEPVQPAGPKSLLTQALKDSENDDVFNTGKNKQRRGEVLEFALPKQGFKNLKPIIEEVDEDGELELIKDDEKIGNVGHVYQGRNLPSKGILERIRSFFASKPKPKMTDSYQWRHFQDSGEGKEFLSTKSAEEFINSKAGQDFFNSKFGQDFITTHDGRKFLLRSEGKEFLSSKFGQKFIKTKFGQEFIKAYDGREFLLSKEGRSFISTKEGQDFALSEIGQEFLGSSEGKNLISDPEGRLYMKNKNHELYKYMSNDDKFFRDQRIKKNPTLNNSVKAFDKAMYKQQKMNDSFSSKIKKAFRSFIEFFK